MKTRPDILQEKIDYYGVTSLAVIDFAMQEYGREILKAFLEDHCDDDFYFDGLRKEEILEELCEKYIE